MSEKFWMTASRPLTSPPFGKLSGVSHSTSSAKDWATAPRSPRMKASYAVRTVWTFSADMVSLQWCLTGTPTLSDPFTTVKHGAQGQRAGDDFTRKHRAGRRGPFGESTSGPGRPSLGQLRPARRSGGGGCPCPPAACEYFWGSLALEHRNERMNGSGGGRSRTPGPARRSSLSASPNWRGEDPKSRNALLCASLFARRVGSDFA